MTSYGSKCAACAGGLGILVCSLLMSLSAVGAGVVTLSKNADSGSSSNMGNMITATGNGSQSTPLKFLVIFFSGLWGQVILIVSFSLMLIGLWFTGKKKIIPVAFSGVVILYISMYAYYSISLEIIGAIVLCFAYLTIYNSRVSKVVKLV